MRLSPINQFRRVSGVDFHMLRVGNSTTNLLRVGIIDPFPMFRTGVVGTLRASGIAEVGGEGNSCDEALRLVSEGNLDIILVNPNIPGGGGQIIISIQQLKSATRLIVLSNSEDPEIVAGALRHGASGYMLRTVEGVELMNALKIVSSGGVYLTPSLGAKLVARPALAVQPIKISDEYASLTVREKQILKILSRGATNKEIARELTITEATVKHFMTSILQKLRARNRVEAALTERRRLAQLPAEQVAGMSPNAMSKMGEAEVLNQRAG